MRDFGVLKGSDLVQVLGTLQQEGALDGDQPVVLRAINQEVGTQSELTFRQGHCIDARSSDYTYRLEQLLYRKRVLERSQLDELQNHKLGPAQSLTAWLLEKEWVSEAELAQVIIHLSEIVAYEILLWKETAFKLEPAKQTPSTWLGTGLEPARLMSVRYYVAEADKNLPVLVLMREKLNNPNTILRRLQEIDRSQLSDYQYHIYRYVNNRNSVRELLQLSELGYFETFAALFQLLSWEYIGLGKLEMPLYARQKGETERPEPSRPRPAARPAAPVAAAAETLGASKWQPESPNKPGQRQFLRRARGSECLAILLSVIKSGSTEGRLVIDNQQQIVRAELCFVKGELVGASTSAASIRLGDLLSRRALIGPGQLREALEEQKSEPDTLLGQILVRHGFLEPEALPELVRQQLACVLYEVLAWPDAKFYFDSQPGAVQLDVRVHTRYDVQDGRLVTQPGAPTHEAFLLEADRNLPILLMIREKLPQLKFIPVVRERATASLSVEQQTVLNLINGQHSLQDILLISPLDYFSTLTALFQLVSTELLQLRETPETASARQPAPLTLRNRTVVAPPVRHLAPTETLANAEADPRVQMYEQLATILGEDTLQSLRQIPNARYGDFRQAFQALVRLAAASE
ncbi:MAG: DUF4388 domain-containing protein [Candidatus Sericytochromatia bacterium]